MILGNPVGAWALLGIPAVLLVHLLQRKRRRLVVHTAFLLERAAAVSVSGRRLDRLRASASLWLQLAVVMCVAWMLVEPRLARDDLAVKAVFVLDSSASLSAFRSQALAAVERRAAEVSQLAARVDYTLLETAADAPALYSGRDRRAFREALGTWEPCRPGHDIAPALEMARQIAGSDGFLVLVTDRAGESVAEEERIAVGTPADNVGFVTGDVSAKEGGGWDWRATVKNYGHQPARRVLETVLDGRAVSSVSLELPAQGAREIGGSLPAGVQRVDLRVEHDALRLDDWMPLIVPVVRTLRLHLPAMGDEVQAVERFLRAAPAVARVTAAPDADLSVVAGAALPVASGSSILLLGRRETAAKAAPSRDLSLSIVPANHPLMRDLAWHPLRLSGTATPLPAMAPSRRREVLLWAGETPLIALDEGRQLVFAFALRASNIERLPAFPLLLHRFVERARQSAPGVERTNCESGDLLPVVARAGQGEWRLEREGVRQRVDVLGEMRAPWRPGHFSLSEGGVPRIEGAAHFSDAREADLSEASSGVSGRAHAQVARVRLTRPDPLAPLALVLGLGLMLADWGLGKRGSLRR